MDDETTPPFIPEVTTSATTNTTTTNKPVHATDRLINALGGLISVRGIVVLIIVFTVCKMSFNKVKIEEPLYTLVGLVIGYYFGQNQKQEKK